MATVSLILGIVGVLLSCVVVGIIPSIIGLILGIMALKKGTLKKKTAVCGISFSSVGIVLFVIIMVLAVNSDGFKQGYEDAISAEETNKELQSEIEETVEAHEIAETEESAISTESERKEDGEIETEAETEAETETETEPIKKSDELTIGSSFESGGLKISIDSADLNFSDFDNSYGLYDLPSGMKYISVSFTFENTGKSDEYVSIYDFDCYADNSSCEQQFLPDDSDFINTNLSSGRNISFRTYYAVPIDSQSIELEYETSVWTGKKAIIKLQ